MKERAAGAWRSAHHGHSSGLAGAGFKLERVGLGAISSGGAALLLFRVQGGLFGFKFLDGYCN
jgi:hypothetical protein